MMPEDPRTGQAVSQEGVNDVTAGTPMAGPVLSSLVPGTEKAGRRRWRGVFGVSGIVVLLVSLYSAVSWAQNLAIMLHYMSFSALLSAGLPWWAFVFELFTNLVNIVTGVLAIAASCNSRRALHLIPFAAMALLLSSVFASQAILNFVTFMHQTVVFGTTNLFLAYVLPFICYIAVIVCCVLIIVAAARSRRTAVIPDRKA